QPVPKDIFTQVIPGERFRGRNLGTQAVSDYEWYRMRMGTGPQGAIKRELFSDKESLWGYTTVQCESLIEDMIAGGNFSWQACHEMFARKGLMLQKQHHGLVIVDAFNHELT
ncbi:relaxase NikB, partial [Escherichia coli]